MRGVSGDIEFWVEALALGTVVILLPAYWGYLHVGAAGAFAYLALASVMMPLGEQLQFGLRDIRLSLDDVLLWTVAIGGAGGAVYALALWLI